VDASAQLGANVEVGPFVIIGPDVTVGDGCRIAARATLERYVRLAEGVSVGAGSVLGGPPQDFKFKDEETWVEVGEGTVIREYATINRGTSATGKTIVGAHCFLMSYVHVAHDCRIGDRVIIANATQIAGHVTIHDHANISGLAAIHQFVTVGSYAFVSGCTRVNRSSCADSRSPSRAANTSGVSPPPPLPTSPATTTSLSSSGSASACAAPP
jgi:UDP-N-acetylglucosamine acyltransferase